MRRIENDNRLLLKVRAEVIDTSAKMVFDSLRIPLRVRAFYWQRRISSFSACVHGFFMAVHST